jgi:alpha-galactosidase
VLGAQPADRDGWHESHLATVIGAVPGPACCVGVCEQGRSFGVVYARRSGDSVQIEVEWQIDALLAPGDELELEPLHVALGDEASELLESYASEYGRGADARVSRPFVAGWCSWYYAFHDVTEDDVLRNLEALAGARDAIPVDVVQLDDGYQRAIGDWLEPNEKFPHGMRWLAQRIRAAGFDAGVTCAWSGEVLSTNCPARGLRTSWVNSTNGWTLPSTERIGFPRWRRRR